MVCNRQRIPRVLRHFRIKRTNLTGNNSSLLELAARRQSEKERGRNEPHLFFVLIYTHRIFEFNLFKKGFCHIMFFARRFTTNFAPMVAPARALATSVQVADRMKIPVAPGPWGDMAKVRFIDFIKEDLLYIYIRCWLARLKATAK